ncbi:Glycosyltransferase involved in cell wall bisynthesis [Paenibacillus algorifonticola]|uniref:Glycosyltransferase involved in cell wall bisynthesis n=1 Tax=Paenibacillus algorifonticola TaxID=684063 RepID=A0A1I2E0I2_9BACL|nr:glycosyltransferase family 4 protein [Paenibacillus algorifonticola]SFE86365.1 Glycosyltransferase involved in cell wall bisynthesis [Paenibacillus algorifonticola]
MLYRTALYFKKWILIFVPQPVMQKIKTKMLKSAFPIEKKQGIITSFGEDGINLVGYARAEMGIGESCRIAANCLNSVNIPFGIINFIGTNSARMTDTTWIHKEMNIPIYNVNVFHINAEQMVEVYANYGNDIFNNKYNIGFWHWELPDFPERWLDSFGLVNEIWVPSTFIADSIAQKSPVPVVKIPHGIEVLIKEARDREFYGLPENRFLFLSMYDVKSYQERKNPQASIKAFKLAFKHDDSSVGLVIKLNSNSDEIKDIFELEQLIGDYQNIFLIKKVLSRNDTNALLNVIDCFVSLHRSEGFGLGLAEAMYLGKPVIGTNWSSNTDFMRSDNSCPVDYDLVTLGNDYGPYEAYQYWAEAKVEHAAFYMQKLTEDEGFREGISQRGQQTIRTEYSPQKVGELVEKRLKYIKLWSSGG